MFQLPQVPSWEGLHPLVIHFPVVLLLIAPLFIVLGLFFRERGRCFLAAALLIMALGTVSTYVAAESGEAAGKVADKSPEMMPVLSRHQELAESTRLAFSALTVLFALLLVVPRFVKSLSKPVLALALNLVFLALYMTSTLILMNTAHQGGRLVHEFGVQSDMSWAASGSEAAPG